VIGKTGSVEPTFPVVVGPDKTHNSPNREDDAFVAKVAMALAADKGELSAQGDTVYFYLNGGKKNSRRPYILLAGASGTTPGLPLPGGAATLPLNWDAVTDTVLLLVNTPVCDGFQGALNEKGEADAALHAPALPPGSVGTTLHFAWCMTDLFDFASNPVAVEIVP
jgi:hypothetical protein